MEELFTKFLFSPFLPLSVFFWGLCTGYFASKRFFQITTLISLFAASYLVYCWADIRTTQAGDVMGGVGLALAVVFIFYATAFLSIFCLAVCVGRAVREEHQKN